MTRCHLLLALWLGVFAKAEDVVWVGSPIDMGKVPSRRLSQNPQTVAEMIVMQGIAITEPDMARVKVGNTTLIDKLPWGKVKCLGAFDTTKEVLFENQDSSKKIGPVQLAAGTEPNGNFIFTTDMHSSSQVSLNGVRINYASLAEKFADGEGVILFFNLIYGATFAVRVANTNLGIVSGLNNMQGADDMKAMAVLPADIDIAGAGGFELRDGSNKVLATTPTSVKTFVTHSTVTLVFIVGDPGNLAAFPYKIVASRLSCNVMSDSSDPIPTTTTKAPITTTAIAPEVSAGLRVAALLHPIAFAVLAIVVQQTL